MRLIVTAADSSHGRSIIQFLESLRHHDPSDPVICFDLGLRPAQKMRVAEMAEVETWCHGSLWRNVRNRGRFHAGAYSWKAPMISAAILRHAPRRFAWLDAGTYVTGRLDEAFLKGSENGVYSPRSRGRIGDWCHPRMLANLGIPSHSPILDGPCRSSGAAFFDRSVDGVDEMIFDWALFSSVREIIAPPGCSLMAHRYDQSIFNLLLETRGFNRRSPADDYLGFCVHCDID